MSEVVSPIPGATLGTRARVWVFSTDPDSPSARLVLDAGGRVPSVLDGWVAVLEAPSPTPASTFSTATRDASNRLRAKVRWATA